MWPVHSGEEVVAWECGIATRAGLASAVAQLETAAPWRQRAGQQRRVVLFKVSMIFHFFSQQQPSVSSKPTSKRNRQMLSEGALPKLASLPPGAMCMIHCAESWNSASEDGGRMPPGVYVGGGDKMKLPSRLLESRLRLVDCRCVEMAAVWTW